MAGRLFDSFGHLTTATGSRKYTGISDVTGSASLLSSDVQATQTGATIDLTGGWDSKGCFESTALSSLGPRYYPGDLGDTAATPASGVPGTLDAAQSEWFVGARHKFTVLSASAYERCIFRFLKTSSVLGYLLVNQNGTVSYYRVAAGASSATLVATSSYALQTGVRYYVVANPIIGAAGSCAVRVDGTEILTAVETAGDNRGANTDADCDTFDIWAVGGSGASEVDDVVIWDTSTFDCHGNPDPLYDWVGDLRVYPLSPDGAGTTTEWTPSAGSNYECVDEKSISDADYVSSAIVGQTDTYSMEDITGTVGAIYGVQCCVTAQKDQPDTRTLKAVILPGDVGATELEGFTQTLTTAWKTHRDIFGTNPADDAVWEEADINAIETGFSLIS